MKRHHGLYTLLAATLLCCFNLSCDELLVPVPGTTPGDVSGDIHFNLSAGGDSIGAQPLAVVQGDTLSVAISQTSSYTDPDGTVYTCKPQASIKLFTTVDTVYAKDIKALLDIAKDAGLTTEASGTDPVTHRINQQFVIGGQEIVFDLSHEVYTYVNSLSEEIEMPYVKVSEAQLGKGDATPGESSSPAVTLRALSVTRASITDAAMFAVTATFSLGLESVNTKEAHKQTLEFQVNYVGVVETVTELYGSISYTINDGDGEATSPFVVNGSDSLSLEIKQRSTYAAADTAVYASEPLATISLKAKSDTAFVEKLELLETLIETGEPTSSRSGENPVSHLYQQLLATSSQEFLFETMYEVYTTQDGDEMPYMMIGEPRCIGIEVTAQKKDATTRGVVYDTVYYDVKAKFEVELKGVNVSDELANTLEFEVNYVGGVINATEVVELVNITYRKNQVFYEGHDNLIPRSQCEVYRDRHYSDGHVETDEFFGAPWFWVESNVTLGCGSDVVDHFRDTTVTYLPGFTVSYENFNRYSVKTNNIYVYQRGATCISSFENVELVLELERNEVPDRYDETYGAELEDYYFNPDSPIEGWYVKKHVKSRSKLLKYAKDGSSFPFRGYLIMMRYYDRFLCVDDTIIGFEEFRPKIESFETFDDYGGSDVHGPGRIYQYVTKGEYLDHTFYFEITDTIYTPKNDGKTEISVQVGSATDISGAAARLTCRVPTEYDLHPEDIRFVVFQNGKAVDDAFASHSTGDGEFSVALDELLANTQYAYRVYVAGAKAYGESKDQWFTTNRYYSEADAVDLGLSVKWSRLNVGVTEGFTQFRGLEFVWETPWGYEWDTDPEWRVPTIEEWNELFEKCTWWWVNSRRRGYEIVGPNGNSIFIPQDEAFAYWSSTPDGNEGLYRLYKDGTLGYEEFWIVKDRHKVTEAELPIVKASINEVSMIRLVRK